MKVTRCFTVTRSLPWLPNPGMMSATFSSRESRPCSISCHAATAPRGTDAVVADPPMRVNHVHMTRAEAVVATLALLESFADFSGEPSVQNLPGGLFIGEGPGTKGNAQRRTLAVESVLRAASVPCAPVEDPRAYVVGVTREGLRNWAERASKFQTLDLSAVNVSTLDARLDELEASTKAAETLFG